MHAKALSLPPGRNPEALLQIAQHETPELVLQPRYMAHANGATSVSGVVICVADPKATAAKYAAYAGAAVVRRDEDYAVELGRSTIVVTAPERLGVIFPGQVAPVVPFLAGFVVAADLARTAAVLDERAVPFRRAADGLLVGAADACGAAVLFEGPGT
jgi:hypothetical protein